MTARATGPSDNNGSVVGGTLRRRGLLAGVAALAAGALAKTTARPAVAGTDGDVVLGQNNVIGIPQPGIGTTSLTVAAGEAGPGYVFIVDASQGTNDAAGIRAVASGDATGVQGIGGDNLNASTLQIFGGDGINGLGGRGSTTHNGPGGNGIFAQGGPGGGSGEGGAGVFGWGGNGGGVRDGVGVRGSSGSSASHPGTIGVLGISDPNSLTIATPAQPAAVWGLSNSGVPGVLGRSVSGNGVWGTSTSGTGVLAVAQSGNGVYGSSNSNVGVLGTSTGSHALYGQSTNGYGLYATSTNSTGIVASTNGGNAIQGASNGNVGVLGTSNSSIGGYFASGTSTGLYATGPAAGFAARFDGPVQVNGSFTVVGGFPKSAAVVHPDGTHRRLYCVESPESWFEDFGQGQLTNGRASVALDRDFAALIRGDDYEVFLTAKGDSRGLYVASQTPAGFEVREQQGGISTLGFGYRVVAKRKDIAGPRLEKVEVPPAPPVPAAPPPPPPIRHLDPPTRGQDQPPPAPNRR